MQAEGQRFESVILHEAKSNEAAKKKRKSRGFNAKEKGKTCKSHTGGMDREEREREKKKSER